MAGMPTNETLIETEHNDPATPSPVEPQLHAVHITADPLGGGSLTVDGHDLSNRVAAGGVTIQVGDQRGRLTKVYLELMGGVTYDGPAEVTVLQNVNTVEFLQSVNPDHLAQAALARAFNENPIDVALEVLIEMAQAIQTGQAPE